MSADRTHARRWLAGAIVAGAIVGIAWAAAGSPLRAWLSAGSERADEKRARRGGVSVTAEGSPGERAGVTLDAGRPLVLRFRSAPPGSAVRIVLTREAEVAVHAPIGSTAFTADSTGLSIDLHSPATVDIGIPHTASYIYITHADRRLFLKDGAEISTDVRPDTTGAYVLPLAPG